MRSSIYVSTAGDKPSAKSTLWQGFVAFTLPLFAPRTNVRRKHRVDHASVLFDVVVQRVEGQTTRNQKTAAAVLVLIGSPGQRP